MKNTPTQTGGQVRVCEICGIELDGNGTLCLSCTVEQYPPGRCARPCDQDEINNLLAENAALREEAGRWETAFADLSEKAKQAACEREEALVRTEEAEAELTRLREENARLTDKFRPENFPQHQCTECGKCGQRKHTPWRDDEHGYGYVCATCLVSIYDEKLSTLRVTNAELVEARRSLTDMAARFVRLYYDTRQYDQLMKCTQ